MTPDKLKELFPNASKSFIEQNCAGGEAQGSKPERAVIHEPLAAVSGAAKGSTRYAVSVVSFRNRLCDPDNLCGKWFVDCLRYAGLLADDTAAIMDYRIRQEKVPKEKERTEITIETL